MRIESIQIRGFGCLENQTFELPRDRAALIIADNEHGKSTLAMAIMAGLCGFPRRKAGGEGIKQRDIFAPWTGDDYALTLRLQAHGREFVIERDFARDRFVVRDAATNRDVSSEFDQDLAASILKLPRDDFRRIALILGKEVHRFDSSVSLRSRLTELVEGSKDANAEAAIAAIENARYALDTRSLKIDTAVQRLTDARDKALLAMSRLDSEIDAADGDTRELNELQQRHADLTASLVELDREYRAACLREVRERLRSARDEAEAVNKLRAELEQLAQYSTFPAGRGDQLTSALTRRGGLESGLKEVERRIGASHEEAARLQTALDQREQFTSATEQDVVGLGGCAQEMENAAKTVEKVRIEFEAIRRAGPAAAWGIVAAVGCLGTLACIGLMILQVLSPGASAAGAVLSLLVCAMGLTFFARGGKQKSELKAKIEQAQESYESAVARATRLLSVLGVRCDGDDAVDIARRTQDALSRHLADRKQLADLRADVASREREAAESRRRIGEEDAGIRSILDEAGIDPALTLDDARRRFEEGSRRWNRYREVKESLLPALEARLIPSEETSRLTDEESRLAQEAGEGETSAAQASAEVESERQSTRRDLDATTTRLSELERKVGTLVENYRRQYPALQEEAEKLGAELAKVSRFGRALDVAGKTLKEVAESTRRRWATALNDRAAAILPHLNPDYDTLLFDDRLDFTVRRASDARVIDKTLVDAALSTGAKDQVYLAVRLACAAELSSAESIPIILDDAFIAFDDHRFETALRYVVEQVAREQQVILLSCHESRHERLLDTDWFAERVELIRL